MRMVVLVAGLLVVVVGIIALIATGFSVPRISEVDVHTFVLQQGQQLTVRSMNGRVTYESWDENVVKIEMTKEVSGLTPSLAERMAQRVAVDVTNDARGVQAIARRNMGSWFFGNIRVNFHVWVPQDWHGEASVSTSNGAIVVHGHAGNLQARTSNGRIEVNDVRGSLEAVTSNGPIRVSGGTLQGTGRLQTSNGSIQLRAGLSEDASYDVRTSNGAVRVTIIEPNVMVDLTTSNGSINLETDLTVSKIDRRHVVGRIGDGAARLNVRTSNGSISLQAE